MKLKSILSVYIGSLIIASFVAFVIHSIVATPDAKANPWVPCSYKVKCIYTEGHWPNAWIGCTNGIIHDVDGKWAQGQTGEQLSFCDGDILYVEFDPNCLEIQRSVAQVDGTGPREYSPPSTDTMYMDGGCSRARYLLNAACADASSVSGIRLPGEYCPCEY